MSQIELNTIKKAVEQGKVANTYLILGNPKSDVIGCALELTKCILKSPFSGQTIPQQQASLEKLKNNKDINDAFGKEVINSYIKLRNSELKEFKQKETFDKTKPITRWEQDNTLDC